MDIRKFALTLATIAAIAPSISSASPEKAALDACAQAFASSIASPGSVAPRYKLEYLGGKFDGSIPSFFTHQYSFDLEARDPKTRLPVARATCSTDASGAIVGMSPLPLDTVNPTLAARF
jgi:hypothetical protein